MLEGSCLCGAVRYRIDAALGAIHHCHCSRCRKAHGAAFSTFASVPADRVRFVAGEDRVRRFRSSPPVERSFCEVCGSNLTFRFDGLPETTWIAVASLDGDPGARPSGHIFAASKAEWFEISDDLPQWPEYPPHAE